VVVVGILTTDITVLQIVANSFLANLSTSATFATILVEYLLKHMEEMGCKSCIVSRPIFEFTLLIIENHLIIWCCFVLCWYFRNFIIFVCISVV